MNKQKHISLSEYSDLLPYEKALKYGVEKLSDLELLAVLLRSGTKNLNCLQVAQGLMEHFGRRGLLGLKHINHAALCEFEGIGPVRAIMLECVGELATRISQKDTIRTDVFRSTTEVAQRYMESMRHLEVERFLLLMLDSKCALIREEILSIGTVDRTCVSTREIMKLALSYGAVSIIIMHNHPSGDPTPSGEDIKATKAIAQAAKLLEITLLDHIVIGDNRYVSLREMNYL